MEGWRCPGCGRCYSPSLTQCGYCGPGAIKYGTDLNVIATMFATGRQGLIDPATIPTDAQNRSVSGDSEQS